MLALLVAVMTSCQKTALSGNNEVDWHCIAYMPISWSQDDTVETVAQIKQHNTVWVALCDNKHIKSVE